MSDAPIANPALAAVGSALIAFLWQGAAIGSLTALALALLRRAQPPVRYATACVGLALLAGAPVVSAIHYASNVPARTMISTPSARDESLANIGPPLSAASAEPVRAGLSARVGPLLEPYLPLVVMCWASGVGLGAIRLLAGWWRLRRMCRAAVAISAPPSLRGMADRVGIARRLRIVTSTLIEVPAVVGWIRPAIVVPAALLASLPATYLDAILAHELAHLRRRDYLVNALQCAVEVLLFYHPAVWWVSQQVRLEREHCCDDEAATVCGDRLEYARAIASLEELRNERGQLALAASGGHLLTRVRRLVEPSFVSGPRMSGGMMMMLTLSALLLYSGLQIGAADRVEVPPSPPAPVPAVVTPTASRPAVPPADQRTAKRSTAASARSTQVAAAQTPQVAAGSISGRVIDPSGGVVPGVTVLVGSPLTETQSPAGFQIRSGGSLVSNARGEFAIADLAPGTYDLRLSIQGFKTARGQVKVLPGRRSSIGFRLEVGSLEESMTISGLTSDAPLPAGVAPAATGKPALPIRVGGDIREPMKLNDVKPVYPAAALTAGIGGTVIVEAVISTSGTVSGARVVQGVPELDEAAVAAVSQWLYRPTMLNGQPVSVVVTVTLTFIAR